MKETRGDEALVFLVGNKADVAGREVEQTQAEEFAKNNDVTYVEVSAKTGLNIQNLFRNIASRLQKKYSPDEE